MATEVVRAIRTAAAWAADQTAMEALYGVGGYYTSLSAWEAAQLRDLVAVDEIAVAECYSDFGASGDTGAVNISGWTADPTRHVIVRAATGHEHGGIEGAGYVLVNTSFGNTYALNAGVEYSRIEGIEARTSDSLATSSGLFTATNNCIFDSLVCSDKGGGYILSADGLRTSRFGKTLNCIAIGNFKSGIRGAWHTDMSADNCTVSGAQTGFLGQDGTYPLLVKNCVAYDCSTAAFTNTKAGSDYNAAYNGSTTSPPGANSLTVDIISTDFVDAANDDYHLTSGSQLKGAGTDLSGTFTTDVDGDTRTVPWDIGFDAYVAAGGGATTLTPIGITSAQAIGTPGISVGAVAINAASINSEESPGLPTLIAGAITLGLASIPSLETVGDSALIPGAASITPLSIGSDQAVGNAVVQTGTITLQIQSINSAEALGAHSVQPGAVSVDLASIASAQAIGNTTVFSGGTVVSLISINSDEAVGAPTAQPGAVAVNANAVPSAEAVGNVTLLNGGVLLTVSGITSAQAVGDANVTPGSVDINPTSIASAQQLGAAQVAPGAAIVLPASISSGEQHGGSIILNGSAIITPNGIVSGELLGPVTLIGGADVIGWLTAKINAQVAMQAQLKTQPALLATHEVNRVH